MARSGKGVLLLGGAGAVGVLLLAAAAGRRRDEAPVGSGLPVPEGGPKPSPPPVPGSAPVRTVPPAAPVPAPAAPSPPAPPSPSPPAPASPSPAPAPPAGDGLLETVASVPGRVADAVTDAVRDAGGALVDRMSWVPRVIARVTRHEGGYESVNPNKDGAGLSFGILQWNRATLAKLLGQMYVADPDAFRRLFGPSWAGLLQAVNSGGMGTVDGAHLWQEPWLSRFRAAGRHPPFQGVQDRVARDGEHFRAAEKVARRLGVPTERALALFFDTAVQQGATAADQVAAKVKAAFVGGGAAVTVPYRDLLATYAQAAANRARRTTPPESASSGRLRWVKVGAEWHLHAGKLDLYRDILSRRNAILKDPHLGDAPVRLV